MRLILSLIVAMAMSFQVLADTIDQDVERFILVFKGDVSEHSYAAESLQWQGLSDPRLFDVIEQRLVQDFPPTTLTRKKDYRAMWYLRALGNSGQDKYIPTLTRYLSDIDYANYAKVALKEIPEYRKWNLIISNRATFDAKYSDETNRVLNLLRSDSYHLKRLAAKRIYYARHHEPEILDLLAKEIRTGYTNITSENEDPIAWMIRGLGSSRNDKYKPLFEEIANKSTNSKLLVYVNKVLEAYKKGK